MDRGSLAGYSLWGHKELGMTERLGTHTEQSDPQSVPESSCQATFLGWPLWVFGPASLQTGAPM